MKPRPLIFLSHSSIDKPFVRRLAKFLHTIGFDTWLDERSIFPGDQIAEAISKGLMKARIVIIVLSRASVNSRWLKYELNTIVPRVVQGKCRLIPVLIEPAITIPPVLRGFNYADFRSNLRAGYSRLRETLGVTPLPTFVDALPPMSRFMDRHALLRTILNQVFDESNVTSLPPTRRIELDFSGPEADASKFTDKIRFVYESRDLLAGDAWRSAYELDDNFRDELLDLTATEGVAYYYLLLADRAVEFQMKSIVPNTNGHVQLYRQKFTIGEPTLIVVSVDVSTIDNARIIEQYLRIAREIFRADRRRLIEV